MVELNYFLAELGISFLEYSEYVTKECPFVPPLGSIVYLSEKELIQLNELIGLDENELPLCIFVGEIVIDHIENHPKIYIGLTQYSPLS